MSGRLCLMINLVSGEIILCLEKYNLKKYSMSGRKQLQKSGRKHNQQSVWKVVSGTLCLEENHSRGKCLEKCVWKSAPPCLPPFTLRAQLTATLPKSMGLVICVVHWAFVLCSTNNVKLCWNLIVLQEKKIDSVNMTVVFSPETSTESHTIQQFTNDRYLSIS